MIVIENNKIKVEISEFGAQLQSIKYDGVEFLYQGNQHWPRRAPVMFPYAGRFFEDKYTFRGKEYNLQVNGFAKDTEFEIETVKKDSATFKLTSSADTMKQYPWKFELHVQYSLQGNKLNVSFKVDNKDTETIKFGIGLHPGFRIEEGNENTSFTLDNDATQILRDDNGQLSGKRIPVGCRSFSLTDNRMRAAFLMTGPKRITMQTGNRKVVADLGNMNHFLLWQMQDDRFVCIEPWVTLHDIGGKVSDLERIETLYSLNTSESVCFNTSFSFCCE